MPASQPSPLPLGPPRHRLLQRPERVESSLTKSAETVPTTASDKPRSTTPASNEKPQLPSLPPLQRLQPTFEARSIDGPRYLIASETSTTMTLPPLQRPQPAYAEAKFIAPDPSAGPSISNRLDDLGRALMPRARNAEQFKVVAVDGMNRNAVHLLIASLDYQITKDLKV